MKTLRILYCALIVSFLSACITTEQLIQNNCEIVKAQHIQTIYFEIVNAPEYLTITPTGWSIYTNEEIARARELYQERN